MWFDGKDPEFLDIFPEAKSIPEVKFISHRIYRHPSGLIYLIGEVENRSEYNINVEVNAYLLKEDSIKGFGWSSTLIPVLIPRQRSPFRVIFSNSKNSFNRYFLKIKFGIIKQKPFREIEILERHSKINDLGNFAVFGRLKNVGTTKVNLVKVIGTFYEKDGIILAFDIKPTVPEDLNVNGEGEFELIIPSKLLSMQVKSYKLDFWTPTGLNLYSLKW